MRMIVDLTTRVLGVSALVIASAIASDSTRPPCRRRDFPISKDSPRSRPTDMSPHRCPETHPG